MPLGHSRTFLKACEAFPSEPIPAAELVAQHGLNKSKQRKTASAYIENIKAACSKLPVCKNLGRKAARKQLPIETHVCSTKTNLNTPPKQCRNKSGVFLRNAPMCFALRFFCLCWAIASGKLLFELDTLVTKLGGLRLGMAVYSATSLWRFLS